jgi:putative component of membrane protein insertase Oxa1/YidC/SpoIIIJ protein YidD
LFLVLWAAGTAAAPLDLAEELFAEQDWPAAAREAARAAPGLSGAAEARARFIEAAAALRLAGDDAAAAAAIEALADLARSAGSTPQTRGEAALAAAHGQLRRGQPQDAWPQLIEAFRSGAGVSVELAAGAELLWLGRRHPAWLRSHESLALQLASLRPVLWRVPLVSRERRDGARSGRPGVWLVGFYRRQIRPVLGSRCQLHPSCSDYFLQASRRHGLRGIPLIADRLVREPGVVRSAETIVTVDGRVAIADPVEDHTLWWGNARRRVR